MFRVSTAGRLEFLIYKESPDPGPSTEVKSIPIEEFGGLEANVRLDGEKYTFAIITTDVTDCFATDTPEDHAAWTSILREYLGKGEGIEGQHAWATYRAGVIKDLKHHLGHLTHLLAVGLCAVGGGGGGGGPW